MTFHRAVIRPEAIALPPRPVEGVERVRDAIRCGMGKVLGGTNVPEKADGFQPHVSLAYVSADQPADRALAAIGRAHAEPMTVHIRSAALIEMHRDHRMYEWRTVADIPLSR